MSGPYTFLPEVIHARITTDDFNAAGPFTDHKHCLLAQVLKRLGYRNPAVGAYGDIHFEAGGVVYDMAQPQGWGAGLALINPSAAGHGKDYRPELIGMALIWHKRRQSEAEEHPYGSGEHQEVLDAIQEHVEGT